MRNLIIVISVVFIAIVAVSYFYFSNLSEQGPDLPYVNESGETEAEQVEPTTGDGLLWTFDLNVGAITYPTVHMYGDGARFILVQDAYHIIHAISPNGQKLWNAQLPGPILGSIQQLADRSLVFTTADRLYRIDTEGDPLPGFSLQLPYKATQGATTSYQDDDNIQIEVAAKGRRLTYDGRGRQLRNQTHKGEDGAQHAADLPIDDADIPAGCGLFTYIGPLKDNDNRYVLCGKEDYKLYCYQLLP